MSVKKIFLFCVLITVALLLASCATPTPETVVAKIKATPPNPQNIRPARGSLADALRDGPDEPHFNLTRWNQKWAGVEAEMKAMTRANDIAEDRYE